jgi:hypothetical protein
VLELALQARLYSSVVVSADAFSYVAVLSSAFDLVRGERDMWLRLPVDPLLRQRSVVYTSLDVSLLERFVRHSRPALADRCEFL